MLYFQKKLTLKASTIAFTISRKKVFIGNLIIGEELLLVGGN
jgi:hypothetical protein